MKTETVLNHYITAALWSSSDCESGESLERLNYDETDLAPATLASMRKDCADMLELCADLIDQLPDWYTDEQFGHDFWLTRNHHGAGFWDRGLGDNSPADQLGEALTANAHAYGECELYVGDDGLIYC